MAITDVGISDGAEIDTVAAIGWGPAGWAALAGFDIVIASSTADVILVAGGCPIGIL